MRFVYKVGIVALFGSFFLMSHNASAVSKTYYLKHGIYAYGIPATTGTQGGQNQYLQSGQSFNLQNNIYKFPAGYIWYSMAPYFKADKTSIDLTSYTDFTMSFTYCSASNQYFMPSSNDIFRVVDYYEFASDNRTEIYGAISNNVSLDQYTIEKCNNVGLRGKVLASSASQFQLGTTSNGSFTRLFGFDYNTNFTSTSPLFIISPTVVFYDEPNEADQAIQKEKENVQNAADDSETQAEGNSTSTQTTNLIGAFQSFVTALTSLNSTNCNVTLAWPSSLGGNMQVNICQNKDYAGNIISIFGSLTLIVFYIPFSLKILSMIYNEIRSFTNG